MKKNRHKQCKHTFNSVQDSLLVLHKINKARLLFPTSEFFLNFWEGLETTVGVCLMHILWSIRAKKNKNDFLCIQHTNYILTA